MKNFQTRDNFYDLWMSVKRYELLEQLADLKIQYYTLQKQSALSTVNTEGRAVLKRRADLIGIKMFRLESENKHILVNANN